MQLSLEKEQKYKIEVEKLIENLKQNKIEIDNLNKQTL